MKNFIAAWCCTFWIFLIPIFIPSFVIAEIILQWDVEDVQLGSFTNGSGAPFDDINKFDGILVDVSGDYKHSGSKSIKIGYPVNEAGVGLSKSFPATRTLYTKKYEYFASGWEGNWPVGLKTSRYYTAGTTYHSEKLIWQTYDSDCSEAYGRGMNSAVYNLDLETMYKAGDLFKNSLPYIRTGHWYKFETWMVMNSGDGLADGVLKIWVDDVLVYSNETIKWEDSARGATGGLAGWNSMWFGGNYSGAICGPPNKTLYRYLDDFYLSTTLDRDNPEEPPGSPINLVTTE